MRTAVHANLIFSCCTAGRVSRGAPDTRGARERCRASLAGCKVDLVEPLEIPKHQLGGGDSDWRRLRHARHIRRDKRNQPHQRVPVEEAKGLREAPQVPALFRLHEYSAWLAASEQRCRESCTGRAEAQHRDACACAEAQRMLQDTARENQPHKAAEVGHQEIDKK